MDAGFASGLAGRRIAVTGAAGFIGSAAAKALVDAGAEVTALVRDRRGRERLAAQGVRAALAPLRAGSELDAAIAGAEVLVHLAYDVRAEGEANLAAFGAVIAAAARAGVRHVVHASSVVVYDDWPRGRIDEAAPIGQAPARGYRAAKIAMEQRLLAGSLPATILQPTIVWGAGSALWTDGPIRRMRAGGLVLPEPCGKAPLVHVSDVARAVALACARADPAHARVLVTGPDTPPWDALLEGYRAIAGGTLLREPAERMLAALPPPGSSAAMRPSAAARASAALRRVLGRERFERMIDLAARFAPAPHSARPGAADLALFTASPRIASRGAVPVLGYQSRIGLADGLALLREELAATQAGAVPN